MFNSFDLVKSTIITVGSYNAPEIVSETPTDKSYVELTEVIISAKNLSDSGNGYYSLSPNYCNEITIHDPYGYIDLSNISHLHIILTTEHIYNEDAKMYLYSEPIVMYAAALTDTNTSSEFKGLFFVSKKGLKLTLDTEFTNTVDYFSSHPEIITDYVISVRCNVFALESVQYNHTSGHFEFNDKYFEVLTDNKTCHFLMLDNIKESLTGKTVSLTSIKGHYDYTNDNSFMATDYLYNDFDIVL